jgi:hypothetical protein
MKDENVDLFESPKYVKKVGEILLSVIGCRQELWAYINIYS